MVVSSNDAGASTSWLARGARAPWNELLPQHVEALAEAEKRLGIEPMAMLHADKATRTALTRKLQAAAPGIRAQAAGTTFQGWNERRWEATEQAWLRCAR